MLCYNNHSNFITIISINEDKKLKCIQSIKYYTYNPISKCK